MALEPHLQGSESAEDNATHLQAGPGSMWGEGTLLQEGSHLKIE